MAKEAGQDRPSFRERHSRDADAWKALGATFVDLGQRLTIRECRANGKAGAIPTVRVMFKTMTSVVEELSRKTEDEGDV